MRHKNPNIKTLFFTKGREYRVILQIDGKNIIMFQTSDDRYIDAIWLGSDLNSRSVFNWILLPVENPEWRRMEETGIDSGLIRNVIASLNYHVKTDLKDDIRLHAESIIEVSRHIWQINKRCDDELPPDPIPYSTETPQ